MEKEKPETGGGFLGTTIFMLFFSCCCCTDNFEAVTDSGTYQ